MNLLDIFSGIGGFSLGLERSGMKTVAFCEIDPFCRRVLKKHWPGVPIYEDIRELTGDTLRKDGIDVNVICGGFPCQDISTAGTRAGIEGARSGLWKEYARIIGDVRPQWVIVENVAALLNNGMGTVLRNLAALGYNAQWDCIPASAVGAPHRRDRIWIIAHSNSVRKPQQKGSVKDKRGRTCNCCWWTVEPDVVRVAHGVPRRVDRIKALGNAVVPQIPEMIGRAIMETET